MTKKKVLIFIPEFSKLTETFILREVTQLVKNNVLDVNIFSLQKGSASLPDDVKNRTTYSTISFLDLLLSLKIYFIKPLKLFNIFKMVSNNNNRSFISTLYLFVKSIAYSNLIKKYNSDIIYVHFMSESSTMMLIVSKILDIPFCISAHAKDVLQTTGEVSENVELIDVKAKECCFISVCNRYAYNKILSTTDEKHHSKVYLEYHGIDHKLLEQKIKNSKGIEKDNKLILFTIGRFVEKKGFKYLIEACNLLKSQKIDFKLYIGGAQGDLYDESLCIIDKYNLKNNIEILNNGNGVDFDTIVSYFKIADIFILPSINTNNADADGIPNVLIESAIFKVPIITTDAGSILEFLEHNQEAIIVSQKDSNDLAESIVTLNSNKKLQNELSSNAYKKAIRMFNIDSNVSNIQKLIISCLK